MLRFDFFLLFISVFVVFFRRRRRFGSEAALSPRLGNPPLLCPRNEKLLCGARVLRLSKDEWKAQGVVPCGPKEGRGRLACGGSAAALATHAAFSAEFQGRVLLVARGSPRAQPEVQNDRTVAATYSFSRDDAGDRVVKMS